MATTTRDPRSIITPDAFSVNPELLGTPLAKPSRRLFALLIDIFLVALITTVTSGFWFVLGVVIAGFFLTRASKRGKEGGPSILFRLFLGCAGLGVLTITGSVYVLLRTLPSDMVTDGSLNEGVLEEQVAAALERFGVDSVTIDREAVSATDLAGRATADPAPDAVGERASDPLAVLGSADLTDEQTAALGLLEDSMQDLADAARQARADRDEALESGRLTRWLTGKLDDIGFGLGWWTMYFAILMPLMKGQTPGKKAMGIRVLRLDGQPVTWWHAFERAGGYAAGVATGLLGFAQVYWDPNRQATHDKIAGTVVIRDGVPKVQGLWDVPRRSA